MDTTEKKVYPRWGWGFNQIKASYGSITPENAHHYVLWSGGTDSTLCLYELLDAFGADHVTAVSYHFPWLHSIKWETEHEHREMFKAKMRLKGPRYSEFTHVEITESLNVLQRKTDFQTIAGGMPQAIAWLFSLPIFIQDGSYVYAGSINEDNLSIFTNEYRDIVKNVGLILNRKIILREPYLYFRKADILEKLIKYDLYDVTWYCELPKEKNKPCHKCIHCQTHFTALLLLSQLSKHSYIQSFAYKKFSDILDILKALPESEEPVKEEPSVVDPASEDSQPELDTNVSD